MNTHTMLRSFAQLFYPNVCATCNWQLFKNEQVLCQKCLSKLSKTDFIGRPNNEMEQRFWGRIDLYQAFAGFYFDKGNKLQTALHGLKYERKIHIGKRLGYLIGDRYNTFFEGDIPFDCIIPVPISRQKLHQRGFNQAEYIAQGFSEAVEKPLITDAVVRTQHSKSQTTLSRFERYKNVEHAFKVKQPNLLKHQNVLIIDDVMTTGATLEAVAQQVLQLEDVKISVATVAFAR